MAVAHKELHDALNDTLAIRVKEIVASHFPARDKIVISLFSD
jgi:hypothetical protein